MGKRLVLENVCEQTYLNGCLSSKVGCKGVNYTIFFRGYYVQYVSIYPLF